jgi:hypothetical protein
LLIGQSDSEANRVITMKIEQIWKEREETIVSTYEY